VADITNPEAIQYCDQFIRPMSEQFGLLYLRCKYVMGRWNTGKSALFQNDASPVVDGRTKDTPLVGSDVNNMMTRMSDYISAIEVLGVLDTITKPNVRDLGSML
jgi:hypothetical protein